MKKSILLLLVLVLCGGCEKGGDGKVSSSKGGEARPEAVSPVFVGEPEGFRDIPWGTEIAGLKDMTPVGGPSENTEGLTVYTRHHESLTIDGIPLKRIEYEFEHGRFCRAIAILEGGLGEALKLKDNLFKAYGPVGPFVQKAPARLGIETPYKQYQWQFKTGSIAFLLNDQGDDSLLLFSASKEVPSPSGT